MARSRNIKPSFFDNERLADCSPLARLLFIGLWCQADRDGRLENRARRIKSQVLPFDDCDVASLLTELASTTNLDGSDEPFIECYEAKGCKCIQINAFQKHQSPHKREPVSALPVSRVRAACAPVHSGLATEEGKGNQESGIVEGVSKGGAGVDGTESRFAEFWKVYPPRRRRKRARAEALTKFARLSASDQTAAISAATQYASECGELPKDAHRFLSSDRWREYLEQPSEPEYKDDQNKTPHTAPYTGKGLGG